MTEPPLSPGGWAGLRVLVLAPMPTEPLDFGNRKRVYHVCAELKARGAEVHYVHYASESDWRRNPPPATNAAMQQCWDAVYTVPVTRPLHVPPADGATHHTVDEWWDPAIGDMLHWLFSIQSFDVLLVNYTWLSKALEFAPRGTLKVLDTHDRFAGRRELLEANGLAPEFFYTTEEQEKIALDRADVVWAIKEQEAEKFRALTPRLVVTVPYAEPIRPLGRTAAPNGVLRFGIVGARNNINLTNLRQFIEVARHYVERTLVPLEIHIAGSCCDDLRHDRLPPFIKLIGRLPRMVDFYRVVDVVLAPMTFSTGLKIKVGEALSLGKALIAHQHAFEGYDRAHDFHTLPDFQACMWACKQVVQNPELIAVLERASVASALASTHTMSRGMDLTCERYGRLDPGACVVLDITELRSGSLVFDHACEVARYLGYQGPTHFVLGGEWSGEIDSDAAYRLCQIAQPVLLPHLHAAHAGPLAGALQCASLRRRSYAELAAEGHAALWFAGAPPAREPLPRRLGLPAFIAFEAFAQQQPARAFPEAVRQLADAVTTLHVLSRQDLPIVSAARCHAAVQHVRVPLFFKGHQVYALWALERAQRGGALVLGDPGDEVLLGLVRAEASRQCTRDLNLLVSDGDEAWAADGMVPRDAGRFFQEVWNSRQAPAIVLDISDGTRHAAILEVFQRAGLPTLRLFTGRPPNKAEDGETEAGGVFASLQLLRKSLRDPGRLAAATRVKATSLPGQNDPGWATIWATMASYRQARAGG